MASQITATLPTLDFPKEVDYPTQEDWAAFSAAAELNFGILGNDWSTQMQLWKTQANAMSTELNTNANIAQGLANYQGDWTSKGYTLGQTVSVSGIYYICKLNHATGQNPTTGGSIYWNLAFGNWSLKADKTEVALKIDKDISLYSSKPTPIDADLIPLSDSGSSFGIKKLTWANLKATLKTYFDTLYGDNTSLSINKLLHIQDQKAAGTNGQTISASTLTTRDLNTVITNNNGATLSSNLITLPAGTYFVDAKLNMHGAVNGKCTLRNNADNSILLSSTNTQSNTTSTTSSTCFISGTITLAASTTLKISHISNAAGFAGIAYNVGSPEIYTDAKFWKVG